jgi:serine/threonine protein kinase
MPIGRYTRLDQIGRGSFATVYQGVHTVSLSPMRWNHDWLILIGLALTEIENLCGNQVRKLIEA